MSIDRRRVAIALAGFSVFVNLYAPQAHGREVRLTGLAG